MKGIYCFAGHPVEIESVFMQVHELCAPYRSDGRPGYVVQTAGDDIVYERERSDAESRFEGRRPSREDGLGGNERRSEKMKLKDTFITYSSSDDYIMAATKGFSGMARGNKTAAFIIEQLKKPTTPEQIADELAARFEAPRPAIEKDVADILAQLRSIGAIEE